MPIHFPEEKQAELFAQLHNNLEKPQNIGPHITVFTKFFYKDTFYLSCIFDESAGKPEVLDRIFERVCRQFLKRKFPNITPRNIIFTNREEIKKVVKQAADETGKAFVDSPELFKLHAITLELLKYSPDYSISETPKFLSQNLFEQMDDIPLFFQDAFMDIEFQKRFPVQKCLPQSWRKKTETINPVKKAFDFLCRDFEGALKEQTLAYDAMLNQIKRQFFSQQIAYDLQQMTLNFDWISSQIYAEFVKNPSGYNLLKIQSFINSTLHFEKVLGKVNEAWQKNRENLRYLRERAALFEQLFKQHSLDACYNFFVDEAFFLDHAKSLELNLSLNGRSQETMDSLSLTKTLIKCEKHLRQLNDQCIKAKPVRYKEGPPSPQKSETITRPPSPLGFFEPSLPSTTLESHHAAQLKLNRAEEKAIKKAGKPSVHMTELQEEAEGGLPITQCALRIGAELFNVHYSPFEAEENNTLLPLSDIPNCFFTCITPSRLRGNAGDFIKVLREKGRLRILSQEGKGSEGIKTYSADWFAVKLRHESDRLICVRLEKNGLNVYVPYKILTHQQYKKLIDSTKNNLQAEFDFLQSARKTMELDLTPLPCTDSMRWAS